MNILMLGTAFCSQWSCQWPDHLGAGASFNNSDRFLKSIQNFESQREESRDGLSHAYYL